MGKQIIMDVTFNLMGRLNATYIEEVLQNINTNDRVKSVVKEGQPIMHYIEIEEGDINFDVFKSE